MFYTLQIITLLLYSLLVSQSFFYVMGYGAALNKLSATAFIEQRVAIDTAIAGRLRFLYIACLICLLFLLYLSCTNDLVFLTNILLALSCLVLDMFIAIKKNIPLNKTIATWDLNNYPEDWQETRSEWLRYFSWRMIACITGFLYFLGGMFFH
jgi:hypothetical protein